MSEIPCTYQVISYFSSQCSERWTVHDLGPGIQTIKALIGYDWISELLNTLPLKTNLFHKCDVVLHCWTTFRILRCPQIIEKLNLTLEMQPKWEFLCDIPVTWNLRSNGRSLDQIMNGSYKWKTASRNLKQSYLFHIRRTNQTIPAGSISMEWTVTIIQVECVLGHSLSRWRKLLAGENCLNYNFNEEFAVA